MFVAIALTVFGLVWFVLAQRRPERPYTVLPPGAPEAAGAAEASPDEASSGGAVTSQAAAQGTAEGAENARTDDEAGPSPAGAGEADDAGITATRSED